MTRLDGNLICGIVALLLILSAVARNLAAQRWTFLDDRPAPVRWSGR